jgi:hypothetical protein
VQYRVELETLLTSTIPVLSETFFETLAFQCHSLTGYKVLYKGLLDFYHENLSNSLTYILTWELGI